MCTRTPDSDITQPLSILTPADLECDRWMQHGRAPAEKRKQKERR